LIRKSRARGKAFEFGLSIGSAARQPAWRCFLRQIKDVGGFER